MMYLLSYAYGLIEKKCSTLFQESLVVVELTGIMEADLLPKVQECKVLVSCRFPCLILN